MKIKIKGYFMTGMSKLLLMEQIQMYHLFL
jgi:hypothetical protein